MNNLFALSLIPYLVFLWFLWRIPSTPPLVKTGFTFLLVFVGITIPAGLYALEYHHTSLANIDWLHGGAESFLTITNILIVLGFKQGIDQSITAESAPSSGIPKPTRYNED